MRELEEFIAYLEEQVQNGSIYVWGAQGQRGSAITEDWIKRRETSTANAGRAIKFWEKQIQKGYGSVLRAFDCSGLGMYWLQNIKGLYGYDMSSDSMLKQCASLSKGELRKGDWVFRTYKTGSSKGKAYHIGYVVDEALNVIEAKGRDDGVVKRPLHASGSGYWNTFGRPLVLRDAIENEEYNGSYVEIIGGAVNIRSAGSTQGEIVGIARKGERYAYTGKADSGWYQIEYKSVKAFVSNRGDLTTIGTTLPQPKNLPVLGRVLKKTSPLMRGDDVLALQQALTDKGYAPGKLDGIFGSNTQKAVEAFQGDNALTKDGKAGKNTWSALGGEWNEQKRHK